MSIIVEKSYVNLCRGIVGHVFSCRARVLPPIPSSMYLFYARGQKSGSAGVQLIPRKSISAQMAIEGCLLFKRRLLDLADQPHGNAHELKIDGSSRRQQEPTDRKSGDRTQICGNNADKASNVLVVYDGDKSSRWWPLPKHGLSDPKLPGFRRILVEASASRAHSCRICIARQCTLEDLAVVKCEMHVSKTSYDSNSTTRLVLDYSTVVHLINEKPACS
jgi:hypothetical protein